MESSSPNAQSLPAGTRLEEFVIGRVLGSGGFGITYLALDSRLDRKVVIKENLPVQFCFRDTHSLTVAPHHTQGDDAENFRWSLENFSKEAALLASLDHPGIVKVLRSFEANGTAYFVMPFIAGATLEELILSHRGQGRDFSEEELRGLLERTLDALAHLHDRGIYHRDIKPGNIFITTEGVPVLIDFGSARQRLSARSMTVVESAGYTPFEQLQSRGNVGPWSDLYALAGTLEKAITGVTPPKANDRIRRDPRLPLAQSSDLGGNFTPAFLSTIDKALEVEEGTRWQSAGEWLAALGEATAPSTTSVRLPSASVPRREPLPVSVSFASRPVTGPVKKARLVPWAVAACLVLGLIAVVQSNSGDKEDSPAVTVEDEEATQSERDKMVAAEARAKAAEQRAARAEQKQQALAAQVKGKEEAAQKAAEQVRLAEQEQQALATQAKPKEMADKVIKATKDHPFVNSLGMGFIPLKITGGPSAGQQELFSIRETRVQDFAEFTNNSSSYRYEAGTTSNVWEANEWKQLEGAGWKSPGFNQTQSDPVTCVSYHDAVAFCEWLTLRERNTGEIPAIARYRLPTDHEWSCAVGIGDREDAAATPESKDSKITDVYPWGTQWPPSKGAGNYAGSLKADSYERTSPTGSFQANINGIHDLGGNVWEWCEDTYNTTNSRRVLRGASWLVNGRSGLSSSYRNTGGSDYRGSTVGFRCVLVVEDTGAGDQWETYVNKRFGFKFSHPTSMKSGPMPENGAGMNFSDGKFSVTVEAHFMNDQSFEKWWTETINELGQTVTYKVKKANWAVVSGVRADGTEFYLMRHVQGGNWAQFSAAYPHSLNGQYDPMVTRMTKEFVPFLPGEFDRIK